MKNIEQEKRNWSCKLLIGLKKIGSRMVLEITNFPQTSWTQLPLIQIYSKQEKSQAAKKALNLSALNTTPQNPLRVMKMRFM